MPSSTLRAHRSNRHSEGQLNGRPRAATIKRSLASGFFLACRLERLAPPALLAMLTCVATILSPENGPLFMVAGDPSAAVGATIGFVGDVIVPGHAAESAFRASLVYTIAWILAAAIMGVTAVGMGTAEPTAQLSQAKGIPEGAAILARTVPQMAMLAVAYLLSCTAAFALKTLAYEVPLTDAVWGLAAGTILTNCLLLCAIHLTSTLIAALCRMPLPALFISLLFGIGPLLAYPRAYIAGGAPAAAWMRPVVWLMHTCSLNISEASLAVGAAVGVSICVIASVLTYTVCNCQEACR